MTVKYRSKYSWKKRSTIDWSAIQNLLGECHINELIFCIPSSSFLGKNIFSLSLSRSDYIILMMYDSAALMGTVNEYFLSYGSWSNIRPERPRRLNDKGRWLTISHMATNSLYSFERNFYFPLVNWAEIFNIKSGKTDRTF